jgi:hypothetical protein
LQLDSHRARISNCWGIANASIVSWIFDLSAVSEIKRIKPMPKVPVPAIPPSRPPQKLGLMLRRSQRSSIIGTIIYIIDARMELTTEETDLVRKYRLANRLIYESTNRQRHAEATLEHLEFTKKMPRLTESAAIQMLGASKTLYRLFRAGWSATAAALSLRITVGSLIAGVHAECKSMEELLGAENAIVQAAQNLRSYLDTATTFDGGEDFFEL